MLALFVCLFGCLVGWLVVQLACVSVSKFGCVMMSNPVFRFVMLLFAVTFVDLAISWLGLACVRTQRVGSGGVGRL